MPRDSDEEEEEDKGTLLSWDAILPDELLQKVLSLLPIANIIKLGIVCKRWYEVVHSRPSLWTMMAPQKPWFFLTCFDGCTFSGHVYDPCLLQWHNFGLDKSILQTSSSYGLVCLMSREDRSRLLVGNPITRDWKRLPQLPGGSSSDYNALALSFDRRTHGYTVVVAKCWRKSYQWHFSVHIYESTTQSWATPFAQDLGLWKGGDEGVVCDGVLYYLIRPYTEQLPHLVAFDLAKPPSTIRSLIREAIPAPRPLAYARLINLSDKLVMVGGIVWCGRPIKGLTIWELEDKTWREVARMPVEMDTSLCPIRENFICSGAGDLVFIQCLERPMALLMFDMRQKVWRRTKGLHIKHLWTRFFRGFCFEPRLDVLIKRVKMKKDVSLDIQLNLQKSLHLQEWKRGVKPYLLTF